MLCAAGSITIWITAGRGGFEISPDACGEPGLYILVQGKLYDYDRTTGMHALTLRAPYHNAPIGGMKTNHFMPQVLAQMVAQESAADMVSSIQPRRGRGRALAGAPASAVGPALPGLLHAALSWPAWHPFAPTCVLWRGVAWRRPSWWMTRALCTTARATRCASSPTRPRWWCCLLTTPSAA